MEKLGTYSMNGTKSINKLWGQDAEFF